MKTKTLYLIILFATIICASCNQIEKTLAPNTVGAVVKNPSAFANEPFYVTGVVEGNGISFLGYKSYMLRDDNGNSIRVKTGRSVLPANSEKLTIRARIDEGISIAGISDKVLVELPE